MTCTSLYSFMCSNVSMNTNSKNIPSCPQPHQHFGHVKYHVLNPLLPAVAFQWTQDTTIDVESNNSIHYHQHILWLTTCMWKPTLLWCGFFSSIYIFNKIWSPQIVATSEIPLLFLGRRMKSHNTKKTYTRDFECLDLEFICLF